MSLVPDCPGRPWQDGTRQAGPRRRDVVLVSTSRSRDSLFKRLGLRKFWRYRSRLGRKAKRLGLGAEGLVYKWHFTYCRTWNFDRVPGYYFGDFVDVWNVDGILFCIFRVRLFRLIQVRSGAADDRRSVVASYDFQCSWSIAVHTALQSVCFAVYTC